MRQHERSCNSRRSYRDTKHGIWRLRRIGNHSVAIETKNNGQLRIHLLCEAERGYDTRWRNENKQADIRPDAQAKEADAAKIAPRISY